ncbi:MAG: redoxin domain-containing protein [Candidatus Nitrosopelagicus sp.]|nr:redoxin domain-containing protein [Candidatus Nitrosopelagicus sp.]
MKKEYKYASIFFAIIAVGIMSISYFYDEVDLKRNTTNDITTLDKTFLRTAPGMKGISGYINTSVEEIDQNIEGKVVLYDFWTYSCINCIRTLPYLTAWDEKYSEEGLVIVGIHTPEFEFEKEYDNVVFATKKFGIKYPVVQDNDKETWNEFQNRYWPRKYIADHEGYIRFDHIGEGAYAETEKVIQLLLEERSNAYGKTIEKKELVNLDEFSHATFRTPELYFGFNFAEGRNQLGNEEGFSKNKIVDYQLPETFREHYFYMDGTWKNNNDGMELISDSGKILLNFNAKQVNIVASEIAMLEIEYDGEKIPNEVKGLDVSEDGIVNVSEPRLYNLIELEQEGPHEIIIHVKNSGFEIFTFTFG